MSFFFLNKVELVRKFWKKCCWYAKVLSGDTKIKMQYLPENDTLCLTVFSFQKNMFVEHV